MCEHLPLGILRQAVMKLDSFVTDINEAAEYDNITEDEKHTFAYLTELAGHASAIIINLISNEMGEDDFIGEQINVDEINNYPTSEEIDKMILDEEI